MHTTVGLLLLIDTDSPCGNSDKSHGKDTKQANYWYIVRGRPPTTINEAVSTSQWISSISGRRYLDFDLIGQRGIADTLL